MSPTVSVIIPVYNRETYIEECIYSVLEQSLQDFEILLVDDGSTDRSVDLCQKFAQQDPRIKLYTAQHKGVSATRNKAIDNASGEYLFFLDSDDVIHPLVLETLVAAAKEYRVAIAAINSTDVPDEHWVEYISCAIIGCSHLGNVTFCSNDMLIQKFFNRGSTLGRIGGLLMQRSYVGDTRFRKDLYIGEDVWFIYQNILKGSGCTIIKGNGYYCRTHTEKSSSSVTYASLLSRWLCKELLWKSEEALGREENANIEKRANFRNCIAAQLRNPLFSEDNKKIRKLMRKHRKELWPALDQKSRRYYWLSLNVPWIFLPYLSYKAKKKKAQTSA